MADDQSRPSGRAAELAGVLEAHRGERHVIAVQDFPDPDAIASAYAHQLISETFDITADIVYEGAISHQENIALVRLLDIDLLRYTSQVALEEYAHYVLVDTQGSTTSLAPRLEKAGIKPLVIVDHHDRQATLQAQFIDIQKAGSTSTIYAEYLEHGLLEMDRAVSEHARLATALMHGIRTDTAGLTRARARDFEAAAFLSRFYDQSILQEIRGVKRTKRVMEVIENALRSRKHYDNYSIAGVGYLREQDRDIIPQVADFLLTEENVHTVVVYGVVSGEDGKESVVGSLRSDKITVNPDQFLKDALGADERGCPYGGGRRDAGGFEIPVGFISGSFDEEYDHLKWRLIDRNIQHKILGKLGKS